MKVSIITATYNSASTITDTLRSVASQNYRDIEHVIVDGLSKDNTLTIINAFDYISKVKSEKDSGIYDAMNKGISNSSGDIIGILNSDDMYADDKVISDIVSIFKSNPDVDCVYADLEYVDTYNTTKVVRKWKSGEYSKDKFKYGWMPPHPTFFVRKRIYQKYGNFNLNLGTAADYELMLRFLYKFDCKVTYLPRTIVYMRNGGASNQSLRARWKAHKYDKMAWVTNNLKPTFFTLYFKPLRKLSQFL